MQIDFHYGLFEVYKSDCESAFQHHFSAALSVHQITGAQAPYIRNLKFRILDSVHQIIRGVNFVHQKKIIGNSSF